MVGKSTLLMRYLKYNSLEEMENNYIFESNINIEGQYYKLVLEDTISDDDYQNMLDMWIYNTDGIILMFCINDEYSLEILKNRYERILKLKKDVKYPMILVGNKFDLSNERRVIYDEAKSLADSWGIEYIEISVKTNFKVNEVFEKLIQDIIKYKYPKPKKRALHCIII